MKTYPKSFSTPELNINVTDENKFQIIEKFIEENELEGEKNTIDGLRVNYKNGWGLIRASNTKAGLVYFIRMKYFLRRFSEKGRTILLINNAKRLQRTAEFF